MQNFPLRAKCSRYWKIKFYKVFEQKEKGKTTGEKNIKGSLSGERNLNQSKEIKLLRT